MAGLGYLPKLKKSGLGLTLSAQLGMTPIPSLLGKTGRYLPFGGFAGQVSDWRDIYIAILQCS